MSQPRPQGTFPDDLVVEDALFHSGRPVLIVPHATRRPLSLERILVCWDGGRAAARAVADAMPFLRRGGTIEVLTVAHAEGDPDELPGFDIANHLARHGLKVDLKEIVAGKTSFADAILAHVADTSVEFMVMGGYGHSRLREFVLGGVTRGMLASMTVPTLMSH